MRISTIYKGCAVGAVAAVAAGAISHQASAVSWNTGWVNLAGLNAAYTCADANYGEDGTYMTSAIYGARSSYTSACTAGNTANTASSVVVGTTTLRAATVQTLNLIGSRIAKVRSASYEERNDPMSVTLAEDGKALGLGLSGGDARKGIGVWVQGAITFVDNNDATTKFDGHIGTVLAGVDYQVNNRILVGLSGGWETTSLDTDFNSGNLDADGFMVAPYVSVRLNDMFSIDATGGYAWLDYDMDRKDAATENLIEGKTDATRYFASVIGNFDHSYKKVLFNLNAGATYTREKKDAFTETDQVTSETIANASNTSHLGQALLGGRIGYDLGKVKPYAKARGEWDFSKSTVAVASNQTKPVDDDFGLVLGAGLDFQLTPRFSGTISGETTLLREDYKEHKALARIRMDF